MCGISADEAYDHVERYDTLTDRWEVLEEKYPKPSFSMACIPIKKRYIYTFGEAGYNAIYTSTKTDNFYKLDTFHLSKGWESITINNPFNFTGCQYGVVPLNDYYNRKIGDISEVLIFGGIGRYGNEVVKRSAVLRLDNEDFSKSTLTQLQAPKKKPDQSVTKEKQQKDVKSKQE